MPATVPVTVRPTRPEDHDAVLTLVRAAFSTGGNDGQEEVDIVVRTWELGASPEGFDLVACDDDGVVVGHVLGAVGSLEGVDTLAVAPLAVTPDRQGVGIGTTLMTELVTCADADGWPLVLLLGNPAYYRRFGFEPAGALGIVYASFSADDPHFQARRLTAYAPALRGTFVYAWER